MTSRSGPALAAASVIGAALAGCAGSQLNSAGAERTIRTLVTSRAGVPVQSVTCPRGVSLKKGLVTICQATIGQGETEPFSVTQKDDKGNVHIQPTNMLAAGVEKQISAGLTGQGVQSVSVTCPRHVPVRVGASFVCRATDSGKGSLRVQVTITDPDGAYKLKSG